MASGNASEAFWNLHRRLRALVEQQNQAGKVRALPLSPTQLARSAERLAEFSKLLYDLFEVGSPGDLDAAEIDLEIAEAERDFRLEIFQPELAELLKRSGYYHAVLSQSDEVDSFYAVIRDRIPAKERTVTKLYLLDGCEFSRGQFEVAGIPVVQMSAAELEQLGPSPAVCRDFFPNESIDSERFSKQWFLRVHEDVWIGYEYQRWEDTLAQWQSQHEALARVGNFLEKSLPGKTPHVSASPEEVAAGYMAAAKVAAPVLPKYFDVVLLLSLYKPKFFEITKILLCEAGWRRIWFRSTIPRVRTYRFFGKNHMRSAVRPSTYRIDEAKWPAFEAYLTLASLGLRNAKASQNTRPLIIASRRYLQGTFATGDVFPQWETESLAIEHLKSY